MTFDSSLSSGKNNFVKHKSEMLNNIYGTTDVFPYWVADMDFQIATPISNEISRVANRGVYSYEYNEKAIFSALSRWYAKRHDLNLEQDKFVQVPGVLSGLALLLRQFSEKGDSVLIHTPAYHQFSSLITKAERNVVTSKLTTNGNDYRIDFEDYERAIEASNVKVVIFCNPHNPTGRVWSKVELQQLVDISARHNVLLISDEIHSDIIYQDSFFTSLTSFDYDKIITLIGSPAKTFGMHSISNGYIYSDNDALHADIKKQVSAMYLDHGNAISAYATIAAFEQGEPWLNSMLTYLSETVDWVINYSKENLPQINIYKPNGTYQLWMDFSGLALSQEQLNMLIFEQAKMGLTPGSWFGEDNYNFMRMNIATSREYIVQSFELLLKAVKAYQADSSLLSPTCTGAKSSSCCC